MLLRRIVGSVLCATKVYHTSEEVALMQKALMPDVAVAPYSVPPVLEQLVPETSVAAFEQSSFDGTGSVTQMLKVPAVVGNALVEYTLTK
jgi:hypothetical protein